VLVAVQGIGYGARGSAEALARRGRAFGVLVSLSPRLEQRRLELCRGETRPLVDKRSVVRAERRNQAGVRMQVAQMLTQRCRLEQESLVIL
jgi:hypothetical protein